MDEPDTSPAARLQRGATRPAQLIRVICQLVLGAGLAITLILKVYMVVLTDHVCTDGEAGVGNMIRCTPTLMLMAYVLAFSAGIDLARRLFEDDAARILGPVMLGTAATALSVLSAIFSGGTGWREALVILALMASLAGLIWLRRYVSRD